MSITFFKDAKDSTRSYYRITRAINGIEKQEYVRIKSATEKGQAAALKKAKAIDDRLENWQRSIRALKNLKGENLVLPTGKVIGIQLQYRKRQEGRVDIEFKLRIKLPDKPAAYRSVSLKRWGLENAFNRSVDIIRQFKNIEPGGERHQMMLDCLSNYYADYYLNPLCPDDMPEEIRLRLEPSDASETLIEKADLEKESEQHEFSPSLESEIQAFMSRKKENVISGR